MHAVIVAGPSGAGKSTFLTELRASRLAAEIRRHLPIGIEAWPHLDSCFPRQWEPFLADTDLPSRTMGIVVHYDMTWHWHSLKEDFSRDPFWQVLNGCEHVMLVLIQPSPKRLLKQWSLARLGVSPWKVHARGLAARFASTVLAGLRRLRSEHPRGARRMRYPRPVRFLKRVDRSLRRYCRPAESHFDFYRRRGNVEHMMKSWDEVVAAKTATLPVVRIRLVPSPAARIRRTFGWRVEAIETKTAPQKFLLVGGLAKSAEDRRRCLLGRQS